MARRSKARQVVLQMLFQCDLNADVGPHTVRAMINEQIEDRSLRNFSWSLYSGVMENRNAIDARIQRVAQNWSLDRMAPTDRNVLRMCVFEMLYSDTPPPVAVDEAIDLARTFGTNQSAPFVNGLLDQLMPGARPAVRRETETDSATGAASPPGQNPAGSTEAAPISSDRNDPRQRMAGHNARMTPSAPGMKAYIQQPGDSPLMTPQLPPAEAAPEKEVPPTADADSPAAASPVADSPVAATPAAASPVEVPEPEPKADVEAEGEVNSRPEAAPADGQPEARPEELSTAVSEPLPVAPLTVESDSPSAETLAEQPVGNHSPQQEVGQSDSLPDDAVQGDLTQDEAPTAEALPTDQSPTEAATPPMEDSTEQPPEEHPPQHQVGQSDSLPDDTVQGVPTQDETPAADQAQEEGTPQESPQDDSKQNV